MSAPELAKLPEARREEFLRSVENNVLLGADRKCLVALIEWAYQAGIVDGVQREVAARRAAEATKVAP